MAEQPSTLLKISVLHFRDESKDEETWTKWYIEEQIPRFITVAHKHGIDRCEVYFTPSTFKAMFQADLDTLKGGCAEGWNMAPYDAVVNYYVNDPQKMRDMLNDPDWNDKVVKFEEGWNDQKRVDVQIGTQGVYIEGGRIVNTGTKEYAS